MIPASSIIHAAKLGTERELLRYDPLEWPISLQLGGTDPQQLAQAASIGAEMGYTAVNLNCGCPSTAVSGLSGRKGGAALMLDAGHVAECCRAMEKAVQQSTLLAPPTSTACDTIVTVKHRLGVVTDAQSYDPTQDLDDAQDFESARIFIETVASSSGVRRFHVHARKAILGGHVTDHLNTQQASGSSQASSSLGTSGQASSPSLTASSPLWVPHGPDSRIPESTPPGSSDDPHQQSSENGGGGGGGTTSRLHEATAGATDGVQGSPSPPSLPPPRKKVNHQREQYKAKRASRSVTIANRFVPPLRRHLVGRLADDLNASLQPLPSSSPSGGGGATFELIGNGGVQSVSDVKELLAQGCSGGMVGRAVVNHPCAFATVDNELFPLPLSSSSSSSSLSSSSSSSLTSPSSVCSPCRTRGDVLCAYIAYVEAEEARMDEWAAAHAALLPRGWGSPHQRTARRRELVAPAFNLFAGEAGCEGFRRRLRKLTGRRKTEERFSAAGVLKAALLEVPPASLHKPLANAVAVEELPPEYAGAPRRSGAMHITVS